MSIAQPVIQPARCIMMRWAVIVKVLITDMGFVLLLMGFKLDDEIHL